mmetsp:Transcript_31645/g.78376  ORF Transcript_31645/g.78376 Transcript_31645/m.78376 type:complete len:208 (-) Transcript_31645:1328-1951(-)
MQERLSLVLAYAAPELFDVCLGLHERLALLIHHLTQHLIKVPGLVFVKCLLLCHTNGLHRLQFLGNDETKCKGTSDDEPVMVVECATLGVHPTAVDQHTVLRTVRRHSNDKVRVVDIGDGAHSGMDGETLQSDGALLFASNGGVLAVLEEIHQAPGEHGVIRDVEEVGALLLHIKHTTDICRVESHLSHGFFTDAVHLLGLAHHFFP